MWTCLAQDLQLRVIDLHKPGKVYKGISKSLDFHQSIVRPKIHKGRKGSTVAILARHGPPVKTAARAQYRMLNEVTKNPLVSARDLQDSLAQGNISVDKSMVSKTRVEFMGGHKGGRNCCPKQCCSVFKVCKRVHGCFTALIAKYAVDIKKQGWVVWEKHTLLCRGCFGASGHGRFAIIHRNLMKKQFLNLTRNFAGEPTNWSSQNV